MESDNVPFVCYNCTTVLQIVFFYLYLYLKPRERQAQINLFRAQYQRLTRRGGGDWATPRTYAGIARDLSTLVDNFKPGMQILKNKGTVKLIVRTSSVEKIRGSVMTFQNIFSSMADFRDVVSVLPCSLTNKGKKNLCNLQDHCIYVFPIGGSIYPWNHKICLNFSVA